MLPRLAVWQVLLTDKVLSARPRSVLERIRKAIQTLCTSAGFSPRQSLGLGGFGRPAQRDRLRARGVCWEKSAGGARAGTCAGKSPPGSEVERELAGSKPAPLCSCGCPRSQILSLSSQLVLPAAAPARIVLSCHWNVCRA